MPTANLGILYLAPASLQKETQINTGWDIVDDGCFVRTGTLAGRPAASRAGRLYWATDVGNEGLFRDTGSAWLNILFGGGVHANMKGGTAPTAAAGANAGTGPPAPVVAAGSNDSRGWITWGTGTTPAAGDQVDVTYNIPYAAAPYVLFTTRGGATQNLGVFLFSSATTGFSIGSSGIPAASQGNGVYSANYLVIG